MLEFVNDVRLIEHCFTSLFLLMTVHFLFMLVLYIGCVLILSCQDSLRNSNVNFWD